MIKSVKSTDSNNITIKTIVEYNITSKTESIKNVMIEFNKSVSYGVRRYSNKLYKEGEELRLWNELKERLNSSKDSNYDEVIVAMISDIKSEMLRSEIMNSTSMIENACGVWKFEIYQLMIRQLEGLHQ